jgi:hypothetical protein
MSQVSERGGELEVLCVCVATGCIVGFLLCVVVSCVYGTGLPFYSLRGASVQGLGW